METAVSLTARVVQTPPPPPLPTRLYEVSCRRHPWSLVGGSPRKRLPLGQPPG